MNPYRSRRRLDENVRRNRMVFANVRLRMEYDRQYVDTRIRRKKRVQSGRSTGYDRAGEYEPLHRNRLPHGLAGRVFLTLSENRHFVLNELLPGERRHRSGIQEIERRGEPRFVRSRRVNDRSDKHRPKRRPPRIQQRFRAHQKRRMLYGERYRRMRQPLWVLYDAQLKRALIKKRRDHSGSGVFH